MRDLVEQVVNEYGTRDPFLLAEKMGITILYEDLGNISTYYNEAFGKKFIHINTREHIASQYSHAVAGMLYYPITNTKYTVVYNRSKENLNLTEREINAEKFAIALLDHKNIISQFKNFDELFAKTGGSEEDKEKLEQWVKNITRDAEIPKYTDSDMLNRIIYLIDQIENM